MYKKVLFLVIVFFATSGVFFQTYAQMMGNQNLQTSDTKSETTQDEAAGKAVWDKLQDKQLSCNDLTDDQFDVLGDFFMGNMMGVNHNYMNKLMAQRLGEDGEKQMHITLGKRLSGCNTNAALPQGASYFMPMMGFSSGMAGYGNMMGNSYGVFGLLTWIGLLVFLTLGSIYFWKKLQKKK